MRALALILALTATPALTEGQIVTEEDFREVVVGVPIRLGPDVVFTINADNTITGDVDGREATGTWDFQDGFWCRKIIVEQVFTEDCQLWEIDGETLVITRDRGRGESFRYREVE